MTAQRAVLMLALGAMCLFTAAVVAQPTSPAYVPMGDLPRVLKDLRSKNGTPLRIAVLGLSPDSTDLAPRANANFRLERYGDEPSNPSDTRAVRWLRSAAPDVTVLAIPIPDARQSGAVEALTSRVRAALEHKPQVLVVQEQFLNVFRECMTARSGREVVADVFADCWKAACLPVLVTTTDEGRETSLLGSLHIHAVADDAMAKAAPAADRPVTLYDSPLVLPIAAIGDRSSHLHADDAAAAYVGLAVASLPADGQLAHLDRASCVWQLAPTWAEGGAVDARVFRTIDLRASFRPTDQRLPRLYGMTPQLDTPVRNLPGLYRGPEGNQSPHRRLVMTIQGDARVSVVDTAAQLTALSPGWLAPAAGKCMAVYHLDADVATDSLDLVMKFWSVHASEASSRGHLVHTVRPNSPLKVN